MNPTDAALAIPETIVRADGVIGLRWDGDELVVGFPESLEFATSDQVLAKLRSQAVPRVRELRVPDQELRELIDSVFTRSTTSAVALPPISDGSEGPISELVTQLIDRAVRMRASDIHIEPGEDDLVVRVRVDGELEELTRQPMTIAPSIVSRLKVLAEMNIVERRLPQDGQFGITIAGRDIDVRLATVSTLYGEKAVLRLLDTRRPTVDVSQLGMHDTALENFEHMLKANYGMIIAAGPTGAGKTTTLQCALRDINTPRRNVSTLEDPVEYVVTGINHIPVIDGIGASFATQLRAILRQDPDIILIGEVRDPETAKIGVQAALSGRLVLTSLHAQDAVSAIYRLFHLDVEPHLVAASLRGVVAQRLLRRVCRFCAVDVEPTASERLLLHRDIGDGAPRLRRGTGCALCRGTGYRDRVAVFQVLDVNDGLRDLVAGRASRGEIAEFAQRQGMSTVADEALELARRGETTVEEAMRLVGVDG